MFKKLMSVISVVLVMSLLLCACGGGKTPAPSQPPADSAPPSTTSSEPPTQSGNPADTQPPSSSEQPADLKGFHIGLMVYTNSGNWFDRIYDGVNLLAEETGCTITLASGSTPDEAIAAVENLCAAGVDGIIDLATGGVSQRLLQICEQYGVYFVGGNNNLQAEPGYDEFKNSEFFVGSAYADDKAISQQIVTEMIGNGATKVALFGLPPGISAAFDARFAGATEALNEAGLSVLTEARSFAMPEAAQNLLTQFPDVDAIFSAVNASNYLLQPLLSGGYGGKLQFNSFDEDNDVSAGFDGGVVSHVVEGVNAQVQIAFVLLYNALTDNKMLMADGSAPNILMPYVLLRDKAGYQSYNELSKGGVYSFEQLSKYIALITPNPSLPDLITLAESLGK